MKEVRLMSPEEKDPELAEDLRRAQPNPPMTVPEADPAPEVDSGYMEDRDEVESEWESGPEDRRVPARPTDPLEADREARNRPGASTELRPDEVGNRPPERRHDEEE
jgi:hypothetical protein